MGSVTKGSIFIGLKATARVAFGISIRCTVSTRYQDDAFMIKVQSRFLLAAKYGTPKFGPIGAPAESHR